jgi:hypothetical protein
VPVVVIAVHLQAKIRNDTPEIMDIPPVHNALRIQDLLGELRLQSLFSCGRR